MPAKTKGKTPKTPSKKTNTKGWPPARRRAQAKRIRARKPWLRATGPRTAAGKAQSARNGTTHGLHTAEGRRLYAALQECRHLLIRLEAQAKQAQAKQTQTRQAQKGTRSFRGTVKG